MSYRNWLQLPVPARSRSSRPAMRTVSITVAPALRRSESAVPNTRTMPVSVVGRS